MSLAYEQGSILLIKNRKRHDVSITLSFDLTFVYDRSRAIFTEPNVDVIAFILASMKKVVPSVKSNGNVVTLGELDVIIFVTSRLPCWKDKQKQKQKINK